MSRAPYITAVAVVGAGLLAVPPVPSAAPQPHPVRLTAGDATGDLALVMGPSTIPIPTQGYLDLADELYLHLPTADLRALATPEGLNPVTGVKSLPFDASTAQGQTILGNAIERAVTNGTASPDHPVTVFGWSQSSTISALEMSQLAKDGVPADDVHFVLVGDPNNPNGGMLDRFAVPVGGTDTPSAPALGITFSGTTPDDLFPTDIYTNEYDGFADFPEYPINFLSDLNAYLGILFQHIAYLGLTPEQLAPRSATNPDGAILLPGSQLDGADTLTNYYMIPDQELPLLQWLQFLPFVGQPLYDLLEPDMRILVNLGYGSIDDGWSPGPANLSTPFGLFPSDLDWSQVGSALSSGLQTGVTDFVKDLSNPSNWSLSDFVTGLEDNPFLQGLVTLTHALNLTSATSVADLFNLPTLLQLAVNGLHDNLGFPTSDASLFGSSFTDVVNSITGTLSGDYATFLPVADTVNTLFTTFPALLAGFLTEHGDNLLQGLGDAVAVGVGLIPFALIFGAGVPIVGALGGTLVNVAELLGLGDDAGTAAGGLGAEAADMVNPADWGI